MGALNANLQVTAGQLPSGVCYDHDENARLQAYAERLIVSLSAEFATFQYGSVAPTSDLGPWFNSSENEWWVWSEIAGAYIALEPSAVTGQVPIGHVGLWSGTVATVATFYNTTGGEWRFCDGTAISRTTYATLFGIIGTQYGGGDGVTSFNIPDTRNTVIACAETDDSGTAKTRMGDGTALLKSRAYSDHKHLIIGPNNEGVAGHSAGTSDRLTGPALTIASTNASQVSTRTLPPFTAMAYVIRIL